MSYGQHPSSYIDNICLHHDQHYFKQDPSSAIGVNNLSYSAIMYDLKGVNISLYKYIIIKGWQKLIEIIGSGHKLTELNIN